MTTSWSRGDLDVDVLEVVLSRAGHNDAVEWHALHLDRSRGSGDAAGGGEDRTAVRTAIVSLRGEASQVPPAGAPALAPTARAAGVPACCPSGVVAGRGRRRRLLGAASRPTGVGGRPRRASSSSPMPNSSRSSGGISPPSASIWRRISVFDLLHLLVGDAHLPERFAEQALDLDAVAADDGVGDLELRLDRPEALVALGVVLGREDRRDQAGEEVRGAGDADALVGVGRELAADRHLEAGAVVGRRVFLGHVTCRTTGAQRSVRPRGGPWIEVRFASYRSGRG